jgi:hypothetical protein
MCVDGFTSNGPYITGRFQSQNYNAFSYGVQSTGSSLTLTKVLPTHELLSGVTSFNGGSGSFHVQSSLMSNSVLVASWSNGYPLVAYRTDRKVVTLNFFPVSSDACSPSWTSSTSGARLMANALLFDRGDGILVL